MNGIKVALCFSDDCWVVIECRPMKTDSGGKGGITVHIDAGDAMVMEFRLVEVMRVFCDSGEGL